MNQIYFKSKVDWWVYAVVVFTVACCMLGPVLCGEIIIGVIISAFFAILEILAFTTVKYAIKGDLLGVSSFFKWKWYPIDRIMEVRKTDSLLSAPALSVKRVAVRFDRSVLKSNMPLEISPIDRDGFIAALKEINADIKIARG